MSGLSRRELLKRGAVALAAGNIYSLLDGIGLLPSGRDNCRPLT